MNQEPDSTVRTAAQVEWKCETNAHQNPRRSAGPRRSAFIAGQVATVVTALRDEGEFRQAFRSPIFSPPVPLARLSVAARGLKCERRGDRRAHGGAPRRADGLGATLIDIVLAQRAVLWREGMTALLAREPDFRVVVRPTRLEDVWPSVRRRRPDVVLLDAELPGESTVECVCTQLCERRPDVKVLILVERWAAALAALTRLAPQTGFLTVDASPAQLVDGLRRIVDGKPVLDLELAVAALSAGDNPLTDREREVLLKAVDGAPTKDIAAELFLSTGTVRNYLSRAMAKTGARSRIEAVRIARDEGWI